MAADRGWAPPGDERADAGQIATGTGQRAHKTRGDQIARQGDERNGVGRLLCGADRDITDGKDNVRSSLGQRRRDVRELIFAKTKATNNDLQVLPLNETEHLELVKKRDHPWCLTAAPVNMPSL